MFASTKLPVGPPEPSERPAGHRAPRRTERLRETARRAFWAARRRLVRLGDGVGPAVFGVVVGVAADVVMVWALWDVLTV